MPLYARGGTAECWIVNLAEWAIEVYRAPQGGRYAPARSARPGDVLEVAGIVFQVAELLGEPVD